jgi:tripartite motif-containing protein 71
MSETAPVASSANPPTPDSTGPSVNRRARRVLSVLMVVLILLLGISSYFVYRATRVSRPRSSTSGNTENGTLTWVRSIYGTSNRPDGLFSQTQAGVPGDDGTIWVTDTKTKSSVMRFTPDGRFLGQFASVDASLPISSPSRLAIGPDGLIYICETALDRIHVLTPDGQDAGSFSVPQPVSVAVSEDRIAVGAVAGFAVLDMKGKPLGVVGSRGKGEDQFDYVHGIALGADGSVYVADSYNNRLSAYDPDGTRRWIIRTGAPANSAEISNNMLNTKETSDTVLKGDDALQLPLGLTIDGAGRVVVADMYECCLAVFDGTTGKFIGKYGESGVDDGQFFYPVSVSYDPGRDWFTVADAMNRRIEIVRIPGSGSSAGGAVAALNRTLAGPLRACAFPLLLLLLAIAVLIIARLARRRRALAEPEA